MRTKKETHTPPGRTMRNARQGQQMQQAGRLLQQMQKKSRANKYQQRNQQPAHIPSFHRRIP